MSTKVLPSSGPPSARRSSRRARSAGRARAGRAISSQVRSSASSSASWSARTGPIPSTSSIASGSAASRASIEPKCVGERLRVHVADARQAEREEHDAERALASSARSRDQVAGRDLAEALELGELLRGQVVDVGGVGDQALVEEARTPASRRTPRCPSRRGETKCLTSWKVWPGQPRRFGQIVQTRPRA